MVAGGGGGRRGRRATGRPAGSTVPGVASTSSDEPAGRPGERPGEGPAKGPAQDPSEQPARDPEGRPAGARVRPGRSPRFSGFIVTGVLLGVVGAVVLTAVGAPSADVGYAAIFGYLAVALGLLGGLLGGVVAVVVDAVAVVRRRAAERRRTPPR